MTHTFMEIDEKERAKSFFSFSQVPFCVCVKPDGVILAVGDPKTIDFDTILSSRVVSENEVGNRGVQLERPALTLDEDF